MQGIQAGTLSAAAALLVCGGCYWSHTTFGPSGHSVSRMEFGLGGAQHASASPLVPPTFPPPTTVAATEPANEPTAPVQVTQTIAEHPTAPPAPGVGEESVFEPLPLPVPFEVEPDGRTVSYDSDEEPLAIDSASVSVDIGAEPPPIDAIDPVPNDSEPRPQPRVARRTPLGTDPSAAARGTAPVRYPLR